MNRTLSSLSALLLLGLLAIGAPATAQVSAVPSRMNFQGRLARPDGTPVADTNTQQLTFRLFAQATGGSRSGHRHSPTSRSGTEPLPFCSTSPSVSRTAIRS